MQTLEIPEQDQETQGRVEDMDLKIDLAEVRSAGVHEIRTATSIYYNLQDSRIRWAGRSRDSAKRGQSHAFTDTTTKRYAGQEAWLKRVLGVWARAQQMGPWLDQIVGIGPVLAAGLQAHIDVHKASSVSAVWRYAGLDPSVTWPSAKDAGDWLAENGITGTPDGGDYLKAARHFGRSPAMLERMTTTTPKGEARKATVANLAKTLARLPWNADLKVICWKVGHSFLKLNSNPKCFYGGFYRKWKDEAVSRNAAGDFADAAAGVLASKSYKRETVAKAEYEAGRLPPAHIDARVRRRVVKLFLSHYWMAARQRAGLSASSPYILGPGGHGDFIEPPIPWDV